MNDIEIENLRNKLISIVEKADDALLLKIYQAIEQFEIDDKIMKEPITDYKKEATSLIPDWHMKEVEERWAKYERGETKMQSWESVKKEIESKYGY